MKYILPIFFMLFASLAQAQIKNVLVEKYYISDVNDSTDTDGSGGIAGVYLEPGSITYRVYIDMEPGSRLLRVYGDTLHALKITSTSTFFNNIDRGEIFGKDIPDLRLDENTVALDTWITLGLASKIHQGVLKNEDGDGSVVGGVNNDGGSAAITYGLLTNNNPQAGIPLTVADGLVPDTMPLAQWVESGFADTTIFGQDSLRSQFISNNCQLQQNDGVIGASSAGNKVLVAQLTTKGEIAFELNAVLLLANGDEIRYVAKGNDTTYTPQGSAPTIEKFSGYLTYPAQCGCRDPYYIEYSEAYICDNTDMCQTPVTHGCMDTSACNYDPAANFNIQSLCCYPGYCSDRDLALVCPQLSNERSNNFDFIFYPNPVIDELTISWNNLITNNPITIMIYDVYGKQVRKSPVTPEGGIVNVDVSDLGKGLYMIKLFDGHTYISKVFIKN